MSGLQQLNGMKGNKMSEKFTYTINLPEEEANVLVQLAEQKGMSKTAIMRQALKLYQLVSAADSAEIVLDGERKVLVP